MKLFCTGRSIQLFLGIFLVLTSCSIPKEEAAIESVETFLTALRDNDRDTIMKLAPFTRKLDDNSFSALMEGFPRDTEWNISSITQNGYKATVFVEVTRSRIPQTLQIPLKTVRGVWLIQNQITIKSTIDIIELNPEPGE